MLNIEYHQNTLNIMKDRVNVSITGQSQLLRTLKNIDLLNFNDKHRSNIHSKLFYIFYQLIFFVLNYKKR